MTARLVARKYELRCEIGRGGMGSVWQARDIDLDRIVALKLIVGKHALSAEYKRRFQAEARALAQLKTEYVVDVYDFGFDGDNPYIVMEHLEGETLDALFNREKRLSLDQVIELARQIAAGLSAAAAQDIVHRDLKPANVFLTPAEAGYRVKLLDFGVAWSSHGAPSEDEGHRLIGTPIYMSPEQIRGEAPHRLSDHWSLAVMLYRALTGELPFQSTSLGELIVAICTDNFPPPSSLCPDLPVAVDDFFDRALAKNSADRFQTPRELVAALAALASQSSATKVLIVDDEADMPALMKMKFRRELKRNSYEFVFADNGKTALEALERHPDVDIVLSDINMPVMDGLSLLDRVTREHPLLRTVMVSAYGNMDNIRQAMNAGAFDFVTKPIDFKDLKTTLDKTLADVHERRALTSSARENQTLRRYVSPTVLDRLGQGRSDTALAFASEKRRATVLCIKANAAVPLPSRRTSAEIARILNARFEVIIPAIEARQGTIDRLHGDTLLALFDGPDHLTRALVTAMRLRGQFAKLAALAGPESPYAAGPRVGLASGELLWTNTGSRVYQRMSFGVLGTAVNQAEHLAECAGPGEVLLGDDIRASAPWSLSLAPVEPRSVSPWIQAYSLMDDTRIQDQDSEAETLRSMAMTELSLPIADDQTPLPSEVETETLHETELSKPTTKPRPRG